jgi:hypothetical protein
VTSGTLTERHLNRAVLARQRLLKRASASIPRLLDQVGGIQAQYAPAMYIALWSRLEGFRREDLTRALERRTVVQGTLQRATIHLVSARDYWPFAVAVREARRSWWLVPARHPLKADDLTEAAKRIRDRLRHDGTVHRKELKEVVGRVGLEGLGLWLDLVRVPPSGTWERRRADLYAAAEDWVGPEPVDLDVDSAVDHVVRRYLSGFGPATVAEIANWAGLRPATVVAATARLPLRRFLAEDGAVLVDLARAPRPDPDTPAPVRFLPVWDATLLAHARRAVILREEDRARVFSSKTPQSVNTFLVDGQVAGTWWFEDGRILVDPFEPLNAEDAGEVAAEADRLAAWYR